MPVLSLLRVRVRPGACCIAFDMLVLRAGPTNPATAHQKCLDCSRPAETLQNILLTRTVTLAALPASRTANPPGLALAARDPIVDIVLPWHGLRDYSRYDGNIGNSCPALRVGSQTHDSDPSHCHGLQPLAGHC